jgi:hypothetical protein
MIYYILLQFFFHLIVIFLKTLIYLFHNRMVQNVVLKLSFGELKFEFSQLECLCVWSPPPPQPPFPKCLLLKFSTLRTIPRSPWGSKNIDIVSMAVSLPSSYIFPPFFSIFKGQPTRKFPWVDSPLVFTLSYWDIQAVSADISSTNEGLFMWQKSNIHNCPFKYIQE